jgi:serine/threonine protein kinase
MYMLCANGKHPLHEGKDTESTYKAKLKIPEWIFPSNVSE